MINKNLILVGSNNSGKSTLAKELMTHGYHYFKLSPLPSPEQHYHSLSITKKGSRVVFDRWSVVDLFIYRNYQEYLRTLDKDIPYFNQHNLIIFLKQNIDEGYYYERFDGNERVVIRPELKELILLEEKYQDLLNTMENKGYNILTVPAKTNMNTILGMIDKKLSGREED